MVPSDYENELLVLAHDIANRLLAAFQYSATQIPYPRVSIILRESKLNKISPGPILRINIPVQTGRTIILKSLGH